MLIIGVDEVGLGSIAGIVAVAAVVYPENYKPKGIADSKTLSHKRRLKALPAVLDAPFTLATSNPQQIDRHGIQRCLERLQWLCAQRLLDRYPGAHVIVDGNRPIPGVRCSVIPKADQTIPAVSAASILAKVYRDNYTATVATYYPAYGFDRHMGYPTKYHLEALKEHGPCPEHRRSYGPVARLIGVKDRKGAV